MKEYYAHLASVTPYAQGRPRTAPKLERESATAYDERTVLDQLHVSGGKIMIPPMAFYHCLCDTASYMREKIPGQGSSTYTQRFIRGLLFNEPVLLDKTPADCRIEKIFTSLPGGGGKEKPRGWKCFPVLDQWDAIVPFIVTDEILTADVLKRYWRLAGSTTGIGVWRTINRGLWGKFKILKLEEVATVPEEDPADEDEEVATVLGRRAKV